jgi:hypothetical protein
MSKGETMSHEREEDMINPSSTLREAFRWDESMDIWSDAMQMKDLVAGDIFYMREPDGEIMTDSVGNTVFVATKAPQLRTDDPTRWKIESVPVAIQPIKGDA